MKEPGAVWQAWQLSKTYRQLPSDIYAIEDDIAAFYFNRAVAAFGSALEADLEVAQAKAKTDTRKKMAVQMVLNRWLKTTQGFQQSPPSFK